MKLDNIDIAKLKLADIPKFTKCLCELCDDGCFEKSGHKHYPGCKHRPPSRTKLSAAARCPLSHYQGTFLPVTEDHRRYPFPPVPDNEIPTSFRDVPMSTISVQREHYPPPPTGIRKQKPASPAKQTDRYIVSGGAVPMETQSHYKSEYVKKPVVPIVLHTVKNSLKESQVNITDPSAAIASKTTSHSHFKHWRSVPVQAYAEMPSIAGHVVFPDSNRTFDTTSGRTFVPYTNVARVKHVTRPEYNGNLKVSGTMDLHTNYRQDYVTPKVSPIKSAPVKSKDLLHEENVYTRRPTMGVSQTTHDYRPYSNYRPTQSFDMEPFLSQIPIGDSSARVTKDSQYRLDYPGYDAKKYPRQPAIAPKDQKYAAPTEKMDSLTVTQRDYPPLDISALPRTRAIPLKASLSVDDQIGPMESVTMSHYHYRPYKPMVTQRRYGELVPNVYIPPVDKFQGTTTTGDTFQGRPGKRSEPFIPEVKTINRTGKHDHTTNYRMDYHPHGLSLCAVKAYTIAQNKETNPTSISTQY